MKLYFSPGSCSMASHISLREAGVSFDLARVDLRTGTVHGQPFKEVNPKGYVPALQLENGELLTEGLALLNYIASKSTNGELLPKQGSWEFFKALEWLAFISTELHKGFSPLWNRNSSESERVNAWERLSGRITLVDEQLKRTNYLLGDSFSVADAYLFTVLNWAGMLQLSLEQWPAVTRFMDTMKNRPHVQAALEAEGVKS
ncbi:glutathione transferase GstA [bacterium]|nr:glutathione transferase GstA [bacterium]